MSRKTLVREFALFGRDPASGASSCGVVGGERTSLGRENAIPFWELVSWDVRIAALLLGADVD